MGAGSRAAGSSCRRPLSGQNAPPDRPRLERAAPGAKTARGAATQAALVRAAQEVFERDGFLDARIADITATARHRHRLLLHVLQRQGGGLPGRGRGARRGRPAPALARSTWPSATPTPAALVADIAAHHRAYLETYHRNARMMRVVEEVTNISDRFRRERTARAQTVDRGNREAIRGLQREGRADPRPRPASPRRARCRPWSAAPPTSPSCSRRRAPRRSTAWPATLARLWVNALKLTPS